MRAVRTQTKPVVFVSHSSTDSDVASALRHELNRVFEAAVKIFCASTNNTIPMGKEWLPDVERHLRRARAFIVLLTHESSSRPWLWFEVGGAWARKVRGQCVMYVLCTPEVAALDVPKPLDQLQVQWLQRRGSLAELAKALVAQFKCGNAGALRPSRIVNALSAARRASPLSSDELATPLQFASQALGRHPSLTFFDGAGEVLDPDTRFDVFARLVLTVLDGDRPEEGFTDEYVYWRVWQAIALLWERDGERHVPHLDPRDLRNGIDVLRVLGLIDGRMLTWTGRELLNRWPAHLLDYSREELVSIVHESIEQTFPTLEDAEQGLENGFLEFGDPQLTERHE